MFNTIRKEIGMKKIICVAAVLAVIIGIIVSINSKTASADTVIGPDQARIAKFWIGQSYYEVNGERKNMDVAPYVKDGRTMLPARYIAESMGIYGGTKWYQDAQVVVINGATDTIDMQVGREVFGVTGWPVRGHFDVAPEITGDRMFVPYRAVAQALGALVFWDDDKKEVTLMTWPSMPEPSKQALKKVVLYKDQATADVTDMAGNIKTIKTDTPIMVTDERDGGFTLDAIEWFHLWGIPYSSMLYDPERGGLAVRGASGTYPDKSAGFMYFYVGEKFAWDNAFNTTVFDPNGIPGENFIADGKFYSDHSAFIASQNVFGKVGVGGVPADTNTLSAELLQ